MEKGRLPMDRRPVFQMLLKEKLARGDVLLGAGIYSGSPEIVEYACRGMDWLWLDAQHSHADWQMLIGVVRAAHWIGVPVLVRTWTHDGGTIERLLDTGAEGIIVPMVDTPAQARAVVAHCYYPPEGVRSFGAVRPERIEPDTAAWNRRIVVMLQIESPEGLANAEQIARVPGVDALHVGGRDLALRLGRPATEYTMAAVVKDELAAVADACGRAGRAAAVIAFTPEIMREAIGRGYRLILAGMDVDRLSEDYRRCREAFRAITGRADREGE
jgi:4-hydroxy-2-oxoheptanedioate aldolase